jgi:hypothetical protein
MRADLRRQIRTLQIRRFAPQAYLRRSQVKIRKAVKTAFEILLLRSHPSLNRTEDGKRRENLKSRIAFGDRRRRRPFGPSLSSNSLCAPMWPCDLRKTSLSRHFNKYAEFGRVIEHAA